MRTIDALPLGVTDYTEAWDLQKQLFSLRMEGSRRDVLLLTEHRPVYTLGKNSQGEHLLASAEELSGRGVEVVACDRGGDVTYHGPGQLVVYPILRLEEYYRDVHRYLRDLEEVIIRTLSVYGISAGRDPAYTGVWVGSGKIAAIGVKVSHWVTMHGLALNVNTDLSQFDRIIPCGIFHKGVTSMKSELGREIPLALVSRSLVRHFGEVFHARVLLKDPAGYLRNLHSTATCQ
jgi:lipoyl(octanoyl) transferase